MALSRLAYFSFIFILLSALSNASLAALVTWADMVTVDDVGDGLSRIATISNSNDQGDKSSADPKSCSKVGEIIGYINPKHGPRLMAASAFTYAGPKFARGICEMIKEHRAMQSPPLQTPGGRFPGENGCEHLQTVVKSGIIMIFAAVELARYDSTADKKDLRVMLPEMQSLTEVLKATVLDAGYKYEDIGVVPLGHPRRAELKNGLQELVEIRGLSDGNYTFDLSYHRFGDDHGLITIESPKIGPRSLGPTKRATHRHDGHGLQLHYTTRHSPLVHTMGNGPLRELEKTSFYKEYKLHRDRLAESIAAHWASQTAKNDKRGFVGLVETLARDGEILWTYKGRKITREANFYFKIVAIVDDDFAPRYESVDSPCGGMSSFLNLPAPGRDKEL